jgi:superfamily II DNA or RNA helicase
MNVYSLRPYQEEGKKQISSLFSKNYNKVLFCSPTGSGKTVTFADMAREAVINGFTVMIVVDRKELLNQAQSKLISYGLNPSLITAGKTGRSGSKAYIATVQTLARRTPPPVDFIIIDEAHKQIFDKILKLEAYKNAYVIGATATPCRTGKMGQLSDIYEQMVETVTIQDLIQDGYLVPAITYGAKLDTSKIKVKGQDFDAEDMYKAFDKKTLYAGVVEKYKKFAPGTKAVCFNINVKHSLKVTEAFNAAGISAVHLDGKTPKAEREGILQAFSKGLFKVLNNVDVLTTGYDEWTIETVIVNRATKSLSLWLQMPGRGSRITPKEYKKRPGYLQKEHFNLIDMGGNVFTLGFWESERNYSLTHKTKTTVDAAPVKTCPEDKEDINKRLGCGALVNASARNCKHCCYIFPLPVKKEAEEVDFIQLENYDFLPPELVGKSWGSMGLAELEKVRKIKGYKLGWIAKQILMNKDLNLIDYANFRGFENPRAWEQRMNKYYLKS